MKRIISEEARLKMAEGGRRGGKIGGKAKNPNKGFGTNRELARELGKK